MIARLWHGITSAEKAPAYIQYMNRTGVADLRSTEGNRGVYMLHRIEGAQAHFLMLSLWESEEHIRLFAGEDIGRARYYPEDSNYLIELEPTVTHFQVDVEV